VKVAHTPASTIAIIHPVFDNFSVFCKITHIEKVK
jgi:hypothetical protein